MGNSIYPSRKKVLISQSHLPKSTSAQCVVRPQQTEGPYFRDEKLERYDITTDPGTGKQSEGIPFEIEFRISKMDSDDCVPLAGALVDLWHCDALGIYSDVLDSNFDTRGQKFLRGYQNTDSQGIAKFRTIYPGWYQGRTVHLHFKIRTSPVSDEGYEFTSQIYFDDSISDEIFENEPYASKGQQRTKNTNDGIFRSGGENLVLALAKEDGIYRGTFDIALQITSTNVGEKLDIKPDEYNLSQNYPNPFNATTAISFSVPSAGYMTLKIYNSFGAEISTLVNSIFQPGLYTVNWDAVNQPSGIYYYRLKSKSFSETKKLVLLK